MADRSSRPHRSPRQTPAPVVRRIVHLRWKQRLGPVAIAAAVGCSPSTAHQVLRRCRINRLGHLDRATGDPVRRYEHLVPGDLLHVDFKKLGNIPEGGGWRFVGRAHGHRHRAATDKPRTHHYDPHMGTAYVHTVLDDHSRIAYAEIHDDETAATVTPCCAGRWPRSPPAQSPPAACCQTTDRPTAHTCGATPAPSWASPRSEPAIPAINQLRGCRHARSGAGLTPRPTGPWCLVPEASTGLGTGMFGLSSPGS
jgi:hypothetical protein